LPAFVDRNKIVPVALNSNQYIGDNLSQGCGLCIQLSGTGAGSGASPISKTPFTVFVHDQCPGCATGDIDLSESGDGRWKISWTAVPCPVGSDKFSYKFQGSNPWYIKLQIVGHKLPLSTVTANIGGSYKALSRTQDNFWVISPGSQIAFPLTIKVTSTSGETVTDKIASITNDILIAGNAQFTGTSGAMTEEIASPPISSETAIYIGIGIGCTMLVVVIVVIVLVVIRSHRDMEEIV